MGLGLSFQDDENVLELEMFVLLYEYNSATEHFKRVESKLYEFYLKNRKWFHKFKFLLLFIIKYVSYFSQEVVPVAYNSKESSLKFNVTQINNILSEVQPLIMLEKLSTDHINI